MLGKEPVRAGLVALLLVQLSACVASQMADITRIMVRNATCQPGDYVEVPVSITGASNLGSLYVVMSFDAGLLEVRNVTNGGLAAGSLLQWNANSSGILLLAMADYSGITGDGTIAVITFRAGPAPGGTSPLKFGKVEANDADTLGVVPVAARNGWVNVEESLSLGFLLLSLLLATRVRRSA